MVREKSEDMFKDFIIVLSYSVTFRIPIHSTEKPGESQGLATLCGRLGEALRSDAYVGFREGQLTLVNDSRS